MAARILAGDAAGPPARAWLRSLESWVLAAGILLIPLLFSPAGREAFRLPKLLFLRAEGLVLGTLLITQWLLARPRPRWEPTAASVLSLLILAWTAVATLTSGNPSASIPSLITVAAGMAIFHAAARLRRPVAAMQLSLAVASVVALVAIVQAASDDWNRATLDWMIGGVADEMLPRVSPIATLGNRNDVGSYLVAPALCAAALVMVSRGRSRTWPAVALGVMAAGLLASNTVTALAAFAASVTVLVAIRSWRVALATALTVVVILSIAALTFAPLRQRVEGFRFALATRNFDALLTFRLVSYLAAWQMFDADPVTGVGPGRFRSEYFHARIAAAERHRDVLPGGGSTDVFEETHNDPLQIMAETGSPGLLLLIASLIVVGATTFAAGASPVARLLALPLVLSLLVLGLALHPLRLAVTIGSYALLGGCCAAREPR